MGLVAHGIWWWLDVSSGGKGKVFISAFGAVGKGCDPTVNFSLRTAAMLCGDSGPGLYTWPVRKPLWSNRCVCDPRCRDTCGQWLSGGRGLGSGIVWRCDWFSAIGTSVVGSSSTTGLQLRMWGGFCGGAPAATCVKRENGFFFCPQ
jgi:hypothetical protein